MATRKSKRTATKKKAIRRKVGTTRGAGKSAKPAQKQPTRMLASLATVSESVAAAQTTLTDGQCDNIASDCVKKITGSSRAFSRSDQLQQYGVNSDQQCRAIVNLVIDDDARGVHRYKFKVSDTSKLSGVAPGWTMGQLANTIQSSATPA